MKKLRLGILLSVMLTIVFSCGKVNKTDPKVLFDDVTKNQTPNTLTNKEKRQGWLLLFDGTTTTGWHGYNMKVFPDCWKIEDASLTMSTIGSKESQDIITNEKYRDFAFSLEYKLTPAANSGVIFQVKEDTAYKFPYETGPEFQIIDNEGWDKNNDTLKLKDWQINGANYAMYPPMAKPYKPLGEWNQLFLFVKGNNVTQILNGVVVVTYVKNSEEWTKLRNSGKWSAFPDWGKYDEGFISLQNHGTKVWFRNIKLMKL
jgi:hypothetical protein